MSSPADVKAKLPKRVADYFIVVGFGAAGKGEDARSRGRTVKGLGPPIVLDRFPKEDWKDAEFPQSCTAFCFPTPITGFSKEKIEPESFSFVMTDSYGTRVYGSAYVIWDELSSKVWAPRCLCLVSHWPFCYQFQRFLSQLHRGMGPGLKYPLERLIMNFICEVPLPPEGKLIVRYRSLPHYLEFCRPPPNKPPLRDFELSSLFEYLSVDNILSLFSAVMTEKSILFTSSKYQTLMNACQVSIHLCCPFFWRHIYIPVLPQVMSDVVCAPMPFMVGMLEKSRPDILMLNNVLIVDLDKNSIMICGDSVTIPPLPKDRFSALLRQLKKLVGDTSVPLRGTQNLDSSVIEGIFLKFHAKLFKNYRDYMEAPSDYVIDRFDKNRFVAQHVERGPFLTEFMLTQMFQCFVDERYELTAAQSHAKGRHLEILFFDEYIDKVHKKPTPFLGDTSLAHATEAYNVLLPSDGGKMPTPSATNLFQYSTFPAKLEEAYFGQRREVAPLVTDDDVSSARGDISKLSMKFFTEKRMYSQHFHALRVRSNKQDVAFNDISRYFKAAQALDEQQIQQFHQMCQYNISKDTIETQSSIDGPWASLKTFINNKDAQEAEAFKMLREEVCTPLYASCSEAAHLLSIRFAEANKLETKASGGKTDVERAKAVRDVLVRKWLDLKAQYADATLSPGDIARLVAIHNEAESAVMNLDLLEVDFQNIVNEYEARMPDIITTIRKLNGKRINAFKTALTAWCIAQRVQLHSSLSHLDELEKEVQQIDAVKDLKSFMTGTTDFWASDRRASLTVLEMLGAVNSTGPPGPPPGGPGGPPPPPPRGDDTKETLSLDLQDLPSAHLRRFTMGGTKVVEKESTVGLPKCYPIVLWGNEGYALAEEQTRFTIDTVDEFASLLEEWGKIQDLMSTRLSNLVKNAVTPPVSNDSRFRVWLSLKARVDSRAKNHGLFGKGLAKWASDLQLAKNQMKMMLRRFAEHRIRLERDLADHQDLKVKAHSKQQAARKAFEQLEISKGAEKDPTLSIAELERRNQRFEKLSKDMNEAEAAYALADRAREAIKVRQDVCIGRMLHALEDKEKEIGAQLSSGVMFIMENLSKFYVASLVESDEGLETKIKQVDYSADLREVIMSCYDKNVPQHERLKDDEPIDLGSNLGWSRFHVAIEMFTRTGALTKSFSGVVTELAQHTESFVRSMKKLPFEMKTCTAPSLGRAFQELQKVSKEVCDNLEQEVKNLRDVSKVFVKHQDVVRGDLKSHQKAYQDMDAAYTKAIKDQLKTEKDVVDAEANLKAVEQRLAKAREKKESNATDLQIKAGYAKQNYENLKEVQLKKADEHLLHAAKFRSLAIAGLLRQMQSEEETRCKAQVSALATMVDFHKRRVFKFDKTLEGLFNKIQLVDVDADIIDFLQSKKGPDAIPPDVVIADLRFRLATAPPKIQVVRTKPQALPERRSGSSTPKPSGNMLENGVDDDEPSRGTTRERSVGITEPDSSNPLDGDPDSPERLDAPNRTDTGFLRP